MTKKSNKIRFFRSFFTRVILNILLNGGMTYVLVMTTNLFEQTGPFSITVHGLNKVIVERLSEYIHVHIV